VEGVSSHRGTKEDSLYKSLGAAIIFLNFSTSCIQNMNNTGTKYVRNMKESAF
jgi:hypothetical protein